MLAFYIVVYNDGMFTIGFTKESRKWVKMIKISISLLLEAIEDNVDYEIIQSLELETDIRKITRQFQGENGEFLVKEEVFEELPFDINTRNKIIKQIKQNSQNVDRDDFDTLLQLYYWEPRTM